MSGRAFASHPGSLALWPLLCALWAGCGESTGVPGPPPSGDAGSGANAGMGGNGAVGAAGGPVGGAAGTGGSAGGSTGGAAGSGGHAGAEPAGPDCRSIAHIGDSLTYYCQPSLTAAYATVGVEAQVDAYGGRAILQKLADDPQTGEQAAEAIRASGFSGCWVVALGTNDTANIAAGAWYTRAEAIDAMMTALDPAAEAAVLWVNTFTELTVEDNEFYANDNMVLWNEALVAAEDRWANLIVFDWAAIAATGAAPFADGIHHTSAGYEVRNAAIAEALVAAYPLP